jgi:hypothetical protein
VYLSQSGIVELTSDTALVGHDSWADGRLGDLDHSEVILNDFLLIDFLLIDELRRWRNNDTTIHSPTSFPRNMDQETRNLIQTMPHDL